MFKNKAKSAYPQQMDKWPGFLESRAKRLTANVKYQFKRRRYTVSYIVKRVARYEPGIAALSDDDLRKWVQHLKRELIQHGLQDKLVFQSFATIREVSNRVLKLRHFDVQLLGGWVMLNGMISEMETGQGKTLTATLPACTVAMAGIPVHIVTANDYLAERDEEILRPLYQWLGIQSASIVDRTEIDARQEAYRCHIVHSTSQQIAFDYLRDRMAMGDDVGSMQIQFKQRQSQHQGKPSPFLLRGLCFTIIDEADSLLIDEAKTPLVISQTRQSDKQEQIYHDALNLASSLDKTRDYTVNEKYQEVHLTTKGEAKLTNLSAPFSSYWQRKKQREMMVILALKARHLFHRDKHYLIRDDVVQIIDILTGRTMPDRSWEHGLHQLIEAKEGCEISGERDPLAKISYQKFFKRYLHLSGMSGTVSEVADELHQVYKLRVIKIPPHKPSKRVMQPEWVYKSTEHKWAAFIKRVMHIHKQGRPLLIGSQSVSDSKYISDLLNANNLNHHLLNAQQDADEASIISKAGELNSITVATNMAGRGTDISLSDAVKEVGGLHVISTNRNDARRIDRQLYGRCARQGDPGSAEAYLSLADDNLTQFYPSFFLSLISVLIWPNKSLPNFLAKRLLSLPQKRTERHHFQTRRLLMKQDKSQEKMMSFTGRME